LAALFFVPSHCKTVVNLKFCTRASFVFVIRPSDISSKFPDREDLLRFNCGCGASCKRGHPSRTVPANRSVEGRRQAGGCGKQKTGATAGGMGRKIQFKNGFMGETSFTGRYVSCEDLAGQVRGPRRTKPPLKPQTTKRTNGAAVLRRVARK